MNGNLKGFLMLGAGAGAMVAIISAAVTILPILRSDTPPFAGVMRVERATDLVNEIQKQINISNDVLSRTVTRMDQQEMNYWQAQVALGEAQLSINPRNDAAKALIAVANTQVGVISARLPPPPSPRQR